MHCDYCSQIGISQYDCEPVMLHSICNINISNLTMRTGLDFKLDLKSSLVRIEGFEHIYTSHTNKSLLKVK
jgi:hypothetical protein